MTINCLLEKSYFSVSSNLSGYYSKSGLRFNWNFKIFKDREYLASLEQKLLTDELHEKLWNLTCK